MSFFSRYKKWLLITAFLSLCAIVYGLDQTNKNTSSAQFDAEKIINHTHDVSKKPEQVQLQVEKNKIQTESRFVKTKAIASPHKIKTNFIQRNIANEEAAEKKPEVATQVQTAPPKTEPVSLPAEPSPALPLKPTLDDDQKIWMSLGLGLNYLRYTQTVPNSSELKFQSLESPTVFFNAGSMVSENWGMDMSYKDSPGSVQSSSTINVLNKKYNWKIIALEGLYQQQSLQLRYGLQQHFIPFMTSNSDGDVLIREHNLTMLTTGFNYFFGRGKRVRHVLGLRYQFPIAQGSGGSEAFSIKPKFAFDGQIGQEFFLTKKIFLGFYWYGQWHDYDFLFQNGTQNDSGHQSLFFSTVDARIGFEF